MKAIRIALLLGAALNAFPQTLDYSLSILQGGVATPDGEVVYALVVDAHEHTNEEEAFVVRLTVPAGLEAPRVCSGSEGDVTFDVETRVLSWSARMDNPYFAQRSCPLLFRIAPSVAPGSVLSFAATLETSTPDTNPGNNTAEYTAVVLPSSDLAVAVSADMQRFKAGTTFAYTLSVTNLGPIDAHDVMLVDQLSPHVTFVAFEQTGGPAANLPMGTVVSQFQTHIPLLPNGSTATFRLTVRANASPDSADLYNRITAQSTSVDLAERNNEAIVWTYAGPDADLSVTATPTMIEVSNAGPDTVQNVTLRNVLRDDGSRYEFSERVRYLHATPSQGTCSAPELTSDVITPPLPPFWTMQCALGALAPGAKVTIAITIDRTGFNAPFQHTSTVSPAQNDPNPANNVAHVDFGAGRRRVVRR